MRNKNLLRSANGQCPHCNSNFVLKTDKKVKVDDSSCRDEVVIWKCYRCNRTFYCATP